MSLSCLGCSTPWNKYGRVRHGKCRTTGHVHFKTTVIIPEPLSAVDINESDRYYHPGMRWMQCCPVVSIA